MHFSDSAYNLRKPLAICGFHLQLWIPRQLKFTKHIYYFLLMDFTNWFRIPNNLVANFAHLPVFGAILSNAVLSYLSVEPKTAKKIKKNINAGDSATNLLFACCGIRLHSQNAVWPRNVRQHVTNDNNLHTVGKNSIGLKKSINYIV